MRAWDLTLSGTVSAADRAKGPLVEVPFVVPEGAGGLRVRYTFDPGNILDLGLADTRWRPYPSQQGFRGWSGGCRREVVVGTSRATPGYLPGPLFPGTWRVLLGLAQVSHEPCTYRIDVSFDRDAERDVVPEPWAEPASAWAVRRPGSGWYRGDLHSHTHHSDARGSLDDLLRAAEARGLDFLAVTDHNTVSHHGPLAARSTPELVLLPGMEITTYHGHANAHGAGWIDFRLPKTGVPDAAAALIHERGGVLVVNHPKVQPGCIGCDWEYPVPLRADAFEVWNGPWVHGNWESLARYDACLREGRRLTLVGGSDRHQPGWPDTDPPELQVGSPTTWMDLPELSVSALLAGLRSGRACVSESPQGARLEMQVAGRVMGQELRVRKGERVEASVRVLGGRGERLRWIGADGVLRERVVDGDDVVDRWEMEASGPFVRAELVADASLAERTRRLEAVLATRALPRGVTLAAVREHPWRLALGNPVYFRGLEQGQA